MHCCIDCSHHIKSHPRPHHIKNLYTHTKEITPFHTSSSLSQTILSHLVRAISPLSHPCVLRSPVLLVGNCPPASRTRIHASVRASAPGTPYLHNASSGVNFGIHLGSNFGLHWVVSCSRREFSNESISSAFDGEETEEEANDVIVRSDAVKTLLMTSLRVELSLLDLVACTTVFDILVCCGVVVVVVNAVTDVVVATIAIAAGTIRR